jgi:hypothetical protein
MLLALGDTPYTELAADPPGSLSQVRGFVLPSKYGIPMIVSYHPAYIVRGAWKLYGAFKRDVATAHWMAVNGVPAMRTTDYDLHPTDSSIRDFLDWLRANPGSPFTYDVETAGILGEQEPDDWAGKRLIQIQSSPGWEPAMRSARSSLGLPTHDGVGTAALATTSFSKLTELRSQLKRDLTDLINLPEGSPVMMVQRYKLVRELQDFLPQLDREIEKYSARIALESPTEAQSPNSPKGLTFSLAAAELTALKALSQPTLAEKARMAQLAALLTILCSPGRTYNPTLPAKATTETATKKEFPAGSWACSQLPASTPLKSDPGNTLPTPTCHSTGRTIVTILTGAALGFSTTSLVWALVMGTLNINISSVGFWTISAITAFLWIGANRQS